MLIDIFRSRTLFLFWFLAFGVMLVVDSIAIFLFCYCVKQFGEELAEAGMRRRRRKKR